MHAAAVCRVLGGASEQPCSLVAQRVRQWGDVDGKLSRAAASVRLLLWRKCAVPSVWQECLKVVGIQFACWTAVVVAV